MPTPNPYIITAPALISFSGGRTSGFMLRQILDAHGGTLPPDIHVCFFNTGKEFPETLDFVHEVETRWCVDVVWLEYRNDFLPHQPTDVPIHKYTARVNYETASRKGEPFEAVTSRKKYLPNQRQRFCTQEMKIRQAINWMEFKGVEWWTQVIGFRADEPHRLAKRNVVSRDVEIVDLFEAVLSRPVGAPINVQRFPSTWDDCFPLVKANIWKGHVWDFWDANDFDLKLPKDVSNCDLCFLKGAGKLMDVIRREPWRADWWIEQEKMAGDTFTKRGRTSYADLLRIVKEDQLFELDDVDAMTECSCTD